MKQKYILLLIVLLSMTKGFSQSNYSVNAIPFQQYTGNSIAVTSNDDVYSPIINLPFNFDFYGNIYNQITVSTNGFINFNTSGAGGFSPWSFSQSIPNASFPALNSVLGCFHDMDNSTGVGTITYGTYGNAPYRKFVIYFDNQPHFNCVTLRSSFQMILNESTNIIDIQLIDKAVCNAWQGGRAVTGIINASGTSGIAAPGRNTGAWTAFHEGWRFSRSGYYSNYSFVKCGDNNNDFVGEFDLTVAQNDLFAVGSSVNFYTNASLTSLITNPTSYTNIVNPQTIYASGSGMVKIVNLSVVDCSIDYDNDTVPTDLEDVNNDTNIANDDTDNDGIPNYLDNDDDGDLVLTNLEYVFASGRNTQNALSLLDTDNDTIPNYLDNDDDGDGVLTWREDYNGDGNPMNDDTNTNGIPDFLEQAVALGTNTISQSSQIDVYPNPTSNVLNIENNSGLSINSIHIYSINGSLIKQVKPNEALTTISVSELQSGVYFVKIEANNQFITKKFVKL